MHSQTCDLITANSTTDCHAMMLLVLNIFKVGQKNRIRNATEGSNKSKSNN